MASNTLTWNFRANTGPLAGSLRSLRGMLASTMAAGASSVQGLVGAMHTMNGAVELVGKTLGPLRAGFSQLKEAVDMAAEMESTETAMSVMLGSMAKAKALLKEVKDLAASTPFEFPELADSARMLIAFGESAAEVPDTLRKLGDVASGVQMPIKDLATIFGKARVQQVLMTDDINQLVERGIPAITGLARVIGVSDEKIRGMAEAGKLTFPLLDQMFRNLTAQGGQYAGMMEKQSTTWKGLMSTLSDGWKELQVQLGTPLMTELKPVLTDTISYLGTLKDEAAAVGSAMGQWVTHLRGAFLAGQGMNALWVDMKLGVLGVAETLVTAFREAWGKITQEFGDNVIVKALGNIGSAANAAAEGVAFLGEGLGSIAAIATVGVMERMGMLPKGSKEDAWESAAWHQENRSSVATKAKGYFEETQNALKKEREALHKKSASALEVEAKEKALAATLRNAPKMGVNYQRTKDGVPSILKTTMGEHMSKAPGLAKALETAAADTKAAAQKTGEEAGEAFGGGLMGMAARALDALKQAIADRGKLVATLQADLAKNMHDFTAGGRAKNTAASDAAAERKQARLDRRAMRKAINAGPDAAAREALKRHPELAELKSAVDVLKKIEAKTKEVKVF